MQPENINKGQLWRKMSEEALKSRFQHEKNINGSDTIHMSVLGVKYYPLCVNAAICGSNMSRYLHRQFQKFQNWPF